MKLVWRRGLFDWENSQEAQLLQEVHGKGLVLSIEDSRVWKVGKDGCSVKSYAFPSAQFTAWRVLFNSVATKVNLERRGVSVDSNLGSFCRMDVESTNHLFFECRITWLVWKQCFTWLGISSVDHVDPISHFLQFNLLNAFAQVKAVLSSIWIAVVNEIWKHKNKHIFQGGVIDHSEMFTLAQLKVWSWVTSKSDSACFTYSEWCIDRVACMFSIKCG